MCQFRPVLVTSSVFVFVFVSVWCSTDGGDKRLRLRGQRAWRGHLRQPRLLLHRNAPQQDHLQHLSWVDGNSYTVLYTILVSSSLHRFAVLVIAQHGCSFSCFPFTRCVQRVVLSPGVYKSLLESFEARFKYTVRQNIASAISLSPLRVANIQVSCWPLQPTGLWVNVNVNVTEGLIFWLS